jgi:hypothetical protein
MVSIIILCRNYEHYLKQALDSANNQTFQNCEVIVAHDSCGQPFQKDHPQGEARMRNITTEQAKGEYILYLDSDDWLGPDAVEKLFAQAEQDTVVTCNAQFFEDSQFLFKAGSGQNKFAPKDFLTENRTTVTALLPKKIWREVGGFDTQCPGWPDWEFWIRVAWKGFKFKWVDEALFHYRIHQDSEGHRIHDKGTIGIDYLKRKHKDKFATL